MSYCRPSLATTVVLFASGPAGSRVTVLWVQDSISRLTTILVAARCDVEQVQRLADLVARTLAIPWGSASSVTQQDGWDALAFLEQLKGPDGLPAKGMIVADISGRISRWDALAMVLFADASRMQTGIDPDSLNQITTAIESIVAERSP